MKVTEYVPAFIDLDVPRFAGEIESLERLTFTKWMERWWAAPGFYQFSKTLNSAGPPQESYLLLAEFEGGKRYYVVAFLEGRDVTGKIRALPKWNPPPGSRPPTTKSRPNEKENA